MNAAIPIKVWIRCADDPRTGVPAGYAGWLRDRGYSQRTVTLYTATVRRAVAFLDDRGITLAGARFDDLLAFWSSLPPTRSSRAAARYALIRYYQSVGRKSGRPANELPMLPAPHALPRPIAEPEYTALLVAARELGGMHRVVGELLFYTGCRFGELRRAAWAQFDLASEPAVWWIEGKGARRRGPKPRRVPLHPELAATLRSWRSQQSRSVALFPSSRSRDGMLHVGTLRRYVDAIAELAEVRGATPHRWRHSTATLALERTRDLRAVQDFLGHASLQSTQLYTAVLPSRLNDVVLSLGPATRAGALALTSAQEIHGGAPAEPHAESGGSE